MAVTLLTTLLLLLAIIALKPAATPTITVIKTLLQSAATVTGLTVVSLASILKVAIAAAAYVLAAVGPPAVTETIRNPLAIFAITTATLGGQQAAALVAASRTLNRQNRAAATAGAGTATTDGTNSADILSTATTAALLESSPLESLTTFVSLAGGAWIWNTLSTQTPTTLLGHLSTSLGWLAGAFNFITFRRSATNAVTGDAPAPRLN